MDRDLCLIVNPTAGAGRAAKLLGAVEAELRGMGLRFRVERTTLDGARARVRARGAAAAGEIVAAMGGDGLTGAVAGELRDGAGVLAVLPGGRGNDFARKLGIPADPVAACALLAAARERRIDLAAVDGRTYLGILSAGLDSDANRLANENRLPLGTARLRLRGPARAGRAGSPRAGPSTVDGEQREFDGYSVAVANSGVYGSGMYLVPDARLDDGLLDVVLVRGRSPSAATSPTCPKVFKGTHVDEPGLHLLRGAQRRPSRPTGRSRPTPTATRSPSCPPPSTSSPARCACWRRDGAARRRAGGRARRRRPRPRDRPRRRHVAARARCSRAWSRTRSSGSPARLSRGSVVISATNGKTTTAAMVSAVLERAGTRLVHNRAGANMVGGVASALAAAARRGGRELDGDLGLFEVDEFWLGPVVEELEPRAILLSNLFRDQLDRYGELDIIADRWAELVGAPRRPLGARAQRRRPARRRPRPRRAARSTSASRTTRWRCPSSSTRRTPSTAAAAGTPTSTRPSTSPTSAATTAPTAARRAPSRRSWPATSSCAASAAPPSRSATAASAHRVELPLPGPLQRLQRARRRGAVPARSSVPLADVAAGLAAVAPAFGRAETIDLGGRPTSILLVKNPAGANEVLRTLTLEGRELDVFGVLNDRTADGRDVSWVWDADWEVLAPHVRRMTCSGTRAAELALRMKYAGVDAGRGCGWSRGSRPGSTPRWPTATEPLYALPTYTALIELRELLARRGQAKEYWR